MAVKEAKSKDGMVSVMVNGREIQVKARLAAQIKNAEDLQRQSAFGGARSEFVSAASAALDAVIDDLPTDSAEALEGMTLVYPLSGKTSPSVHPDGRVKIAKRASKVGVAGGTSD